MKRRRIILILLLVLLAFSVVYFNPDLYWPVVGWLGREAYYQGKPTSF
jgi:uncharacterized RDD family membrane protein YckC